MIINITLFLLILLLSFEISYAHVSERALTLLLPTEIYIPSGIAVLVLTILITYISPKAFIGKLFRTYEIIFFKRFNFISSIDLNSIKVFMSLISFFLLIILIVLGFTGSRDPLVNPLSLFIWSVWFLVMPLAQMIFGNIWSFLNPWYGIGKILFKNNFFFKLDNNLTLVIPSLFFLLFSLFMLVDIAPDDPDRLATVVSLYFLLNFFCIWLFGIEWLKKGECFSVFFGMLSKLSLFWFENRKAYFGFFGSQLTHINYLPPLTVLFLAIILATLSFDGLNETFFWFKIININPLEFHGRSSVIFQNSIGLLAFAIFLFFIFLLTIYLGHKFIYEEIEFNKIIGINSIALLPIAIAYHIAHYLTTFLVNIQYFYKVLSDPFNNGSNYFGTGNIHVTTSFFNSIETVRIIWLIQAFAIVFGHVIAVLLAHSISEKYLKSKSSLLISQFPISIFMICYTFLGLWILSTPSVG